MVRYIAPYEFRVYSCSPHEIGKTVISQGKFVVNMKKSPILFFTAEIAEFGEFFCKDLVRCNML